MPNGTYGGVRGEETKVGQKTFVSRPTRLYRYFAIYVQMPDRITPRYTVVSACLLDLITGHYRIVQSCE